MFKPRLYQTERLTLRSLRMDDYQRVLEAHENALPKQNKFDLEPVPPGRLTVERFTSNVLRQRQEAESDTTYIWNIFLTKTDELIGWMDISTVNRNPHQMANFGYFIFNRHRGQGYACEAARRLIRAGFEDLKYHRLEASIDLDNEASIRTAERIGMHKEGIKKYYWFQGGRWEDQVVYIATPELFP